VQGAMAALVTGMEGGQRALLRHTIDHTALLLVLQLLLPAKPPNTSTPARPATAAHLDGSKLHKGKRLCRGAHPGGPHQPH